MGKRVLLMGSTQTKHIAKLLGSNNIQCVDINEHTNDVHQGFAKKVFIAKTLLQSDILYFVGGTYEKSKVVILAKVLGKKIIRHWIGTDVLLALEAAKKGVKFQKSDIELAGSELLVEELGGIGIKACKVPIVPFESKFFLKDMPVKHSVLVYLPEGKEKFYGGDIIKELARREPDIQFNIVANKGVDDLKYDNVKFHGQLNSDEMARLYDEITVLVRYPNHDGLSMMVIEALGMGKHVLYKYKHPYVETPKSEDINDIYESFKRIIDKPIKINKEGHEFVKEFYSSENIMGLYHENYAFD